jgi:hypothetical protein
MANTYLTRTPASDGNRKTFTFSGWIKRSKLGEAVIYSQGTGNNNFTLEFTSNDELNVREYEGSIKLELKSNAKFRDINAWYHIVLSVDTTQAISSDRIKVYINNNKITNWSISTYPSLNHNTFVNGTSEARIGRYRDGNRYFDGLMSHLHLSDGTAYNADTFGEEDLTTEIWKIITNPTVTYGTNGFFILKDSNSLIDESGNNNTFTVDGGTLTNTESSPSNIFATGNFLIPSDLAYSNGNCTIETLFPIINTWESTGSTIAVAKGKFYAEFKYISGTNVIIGVEDMKKVNDWKNEYMGYSSNGRGYRKDGKSINNNLASTFGNSFSTGDIIGVALDMDNKFVYMSKNGVFQNSGDPTSGSSGTGGLSLSGTEYVIGASVFDAKISANFGNGLFGTTTITSEGTNASGIGLFEYDVPTGYTALSTKGLNL